VSATPPYAWFIPVDSVQPVTETVCSADPAAVEWYSASVAVAPVLDEEESTRMLVALGAAVNARPAAGATQSPASSSPSRDAHADGSAARRCGEGEVSREVVRS
jgi:hypothetical protein